MIVGPGDGYQLYSSTLWQIGQGLVTADTDGCGRKRSLQFRIPPECEISGQQKPGNFRCWGEFHTTFTADTSGTIRNERSRGEIQPSERQKPRSYAPA